ncbi:hypothetical protein [Celeribacter litoreus]|uniref:hypothetical protein n=1 Tax=Celeribacter litoreus TaxID=2876714 RepID=UPI001CCEAB36|nr:hypothetical protein [Celeribacter litoreus]MCA0045139.1 hypothetical protein [Celeribacter litoreus]
MLKSHSKDFLNDDDGAVTVDFVVLTSAIIGMGIMVIGIIWEGAFGFTEQLDADIQQISVLVH